MDGIKMTQDINIALEQIANKETLSVTEIVEQLANELPHIEFHVGKQKKPRLRSKRLKLIKEVWKLQKHR